MAKVLLVDDDKDMVAMYTAVLRHRGHEMLTAYGVREAQEVLKAHRPDVIVLDVMMETTTAGFDFARELHESLSTVPVLLLTGVNHLSDHSFQADETWLPVAEIFEKPLPAQRLAEQVERLVSEG